MMNRLRRSRGLATMEALEPRLLLAADVLISEIMYHPSSEDILEEYIELHNRGDATAHLAGWRFINGIDFTFPDVDLPSGGYLVVPADPAAFQAKYPTVWNFVDQGWTGRLSNSGEQIELVDAAGRQIDQVDYADEGDWSIRQQGPLDRGYRGWVWSEIHDGGGRSLELINPALSNNQGQNWAASLVVNGTPGGPNSVAAGNIAPMILDPSHSPAIPRSADPVTITARIVDELMTGLTVTLWHRLDGQPSFANLLMYDDGQHADGAAGDGTYGASLPARPDETVVEWYVEAMDAGGRSRTWPAPVENMGQAANALYQVDDSYNPDEAWTPGRQPVYRLIMTEKERADLAYIGSHSANCDSNAQMNGTFISLDGTGIDVRYLTGMRNRGNGTRLGPPNNYHVNIPHDRPWHGVTALNINRNNTYNQVIGGVLFHMSGVGSPDQTRVQTFVNSQNLASTGSGMYGSYASKEVFDSDFAEHWFPEDPDGNLYLCFYDDSVSPRDVADLRYEGPTPAPYRNCYFKQTNASEDDWSDLIQLTYTFANAPNATFYEQISQVIDIEQWVRYLAADTLMGNNEGGLCTGVGDDYGLYRGLIDTRFRLVPHDLDTLFDSGTTTRSIFAYASISALNRLLSNPDVVQLYYSNLLELMDTVFSPAVVNPAIDSVLGGWAPQSSIDSRKAFVVSRTASVRSQIPQGPLTVTSPLPVSGGYPRTTGTTFTLSGTTNPARTRAVLVNGRPATRTGRNGAWSFSSAVEGGGVTLRPGLNRVLVQALDASGNEIESAYVDIWRDTGSTNDYPVGGEPAPPTAPPVISAAMQVRDSYLPGTPVLVRVEIRQDGDTVYRDLWDATATLTADNPAVALSTSQVTLRNGLGSALVTFTGSGNFNLTATVSGMQVSKSLTDLTGQPITSVSGTLGSSTVWSGIIRVTGDLTVPASATLTIQPGTLVLLNGVTSGDTGTDIDVLGTIQSMGTASSPVTFTAYDPATRWGEIHHSNAGASLYQYTDITLAGRSPGGGHTGTGPAVRPGNSAITFDHANITDTAGKTIEGSGSNLTFRSSLFSRSVMGPEISGTALIFEDSWIIDMRNPDDADAIYIHDQQAGQTVRMTGGVICGTNDDGIDTLGCTMTIEDYIIRGTNDKGVSVYDGEVTINRTLVTDCALVPEDGTASVVSAKGYDGSTVVVRMDHCTVISPNIGIQGRNKYGVSNVVIQYYVTNCIIQAPDPVQTDYNPDDIHISYSDVYGEAWPGTGNLNQDPLFVNPAGHDYRLQEPSPCIDAGDPASSQDPDLTVTDQGCYWYEQAQQELPQGSLSQDEVWGPASGQYRIVGELTVPAGITLTILPGTTVFFEPNAKLIVQGRLMAEGAADDLIRFALTPGASGNWNGIQLISTMQDNRITHAIVEYGRTNDGMIGVQDSRLLLDGVTFDHTDLRRLRTERSSLIARDCTFTDIFPGSQAPTTNNLSEHIWGGGVPQGGWFIIENNVFGTTKGHNDAIDFGGSAWVSYVIPQFLNNHFMGVGDDAMDLETDAYIEGNLFEHVHRDAYNTDAGESNSISAGAGHTYTLVRNLFHDVDHAILVKDNSFLYFLNNTVLDADISAVYFRVPGDSGYGRGAYVDGSIIWQTPAAFAEVGGGIALTVNRSIVPAEWHSRGTGNIAEDPRLDGSDMSLGAGSPARGTGPSGLDMGADVPAGAAIADGPPDLTYSTAATFTVGGPGITHYKYRLDGGAWGDETPVAAPIELAGLADGQHALEVIGKNVAGAWQSEGALARRSWAISSALSRILINELLALNNAAVDHEGTFPDIIELYNDSPQQVDLGGMSITDDPASPRKFTFAYGTTIPGEGYLRLYADNNTTTSGIHLGFALDGEGDGVYLYGRSVGGGQPPLLDSVEFGVQAADLSIGRVGPDRHWALTQPTPGGPNIAQRTGNPATLKINEWFANGDVVFNDDFVELYSPDPLPVDLGGLYMTDVIALPTRHQFGALNFIAGGGFVEFRADSSTAPGHVDFRLSADQEIIGLFDAQLNEIDRVLYMPQTTDVSQGLSPDGGTTYKFYTLPTPGVANPVTSTTNTVEVDFLNIDAVWSYNQSNADLLTAWREYSYPAEASWPTGKALLYVESASLPAPKNTPLTLKAPGFTTQTPTYYFRAHFTFDGDPANVIRFQARTIVDDGAVIYINGRRQYLLRMSDPVNHTKLTDGSAVGNAVYEGPFNMTVADLHHGDNVIAVEVHQKNLTSTDIVFGLELDATVQVTTGQDELAGIYALQKGLRITEVMYNPIGGSNYEFIELQNVGDDDLDLTGVRIRGGVEFTFPAWTLSPGQYVLVVNDLNAFRNRYGQGLPVAGEFQDNLSNGGEEIVLQLPDPYDAAILRFDYDDDWYPATDGSGPSLVLVDAAARATAWRERSAWTASQVSGGSPGAAEPTSPYPPGAIVINEILAHQDVPTGDWIELLNTTDGQIDIGGWYLSDDGADLMKFQVPTPTVLEAGQYIVFTQAGDFGQGVIPKGFGLSELGDEVYLSSGSGGQLGGYREYVIFGATDNGVTLGRHIASDGQVDYTAMESATPWEANSPPRVGPVVIEEIMYHPPQGREEYLLLRNITAEPVDLFDPAHPQNTWKLTDGIEFTFPEGVTVPPDGYVMVVPIDPDLFRATYNVPAEVLVVGPYQDNLSNGGEVVELSKPGNPEPDGFVPYVVAERVSYNDASPWPTQADGWGPALARRDVTAYGNDPANWAFSGGPTAQTWAVDLSREIEIPELTFTFSRAVFAEPEDVTVLDASQSPVAAEFTVAGAGTKAVKVTFTAQLRYGGPYTLTLSGAGVTDAVGRGLEDGDFRASFIVAIPGDTDLDGEVSFLDYLTVKAGFGSAGAAWSAGDFDYDGDVDFMDYLTVKANFGQVYGAGSAEVLAAEVLAPAAPPAAADEAPAGPAEAAPAPAADGLPSVAWVEFPRGDGTAHDGGQATASAQAAAPADAGLAGLDLVAPVIAAAPGGLDALAGLAGEQDAAPPVLAASAGGRSAEPDLLDVLALSRLQAPLGA